MIISRIFKNILISHGIKKLILTKQQVLHIIATPAFSMSKLFYIHRCIVTVLLAKTSLRLDESCKVQKGELNENTCTFFGRNH